MAGKRRTAYFGGTFDPVHEGHIGLAQAVVKHGFSDRVWFAPAFVPPHKRRRRITAYVHRLNMLTLALRGLDALEATDFEARIALNPSYSCEVMRRLRAAYPEEHWQLLIGADSLLELHGWFQAKTLVNECEILTAPRPGVVVTQEFLIKNWGVENGGRLYRSLLPLPEFDASSTKIREKVANRVVLPEIQSYIEMCGLYEGVTGGEENWKTKH